MDRLISPIIFKREIEQDLARPNIGKTPSNGQKEPLFPATLGVPFGTGSSKRSRGASPPCGFDP